MYEYVGNLHAHTTYSDGAGTHAVVAAAAIRAGLDFVLTTDHNVLVQGVEGYYRNPDGRQVLLLTGEEAHDMQRDPQRNHLLVYGAHAEMAPAAQNRPPQRLLDAVNAAGGCAFLAHPIDRAVPWLGEGSYSWEDWDLQGYAGIELWNTMSSLKPLLATPFSTAVAVFDFPGRLAGPDPDILALWDRLLAEGRRVSAVGNSDAHATPMRAGPLKRVIFPYEMLFRMVNTHVLLEHPLTGDWRADGGALLEAVGRGRSFVGYGLPGDPRGFRFEARTESGETLATFGGDVRPGQAVELRISAPAPARLRLIRQGEVVKEGYGTALTYRPSQPGAYRAEAWRAYRGRERGWAFSNPIYVR